VRFTTRRGLTRRVRATWKGFIFTSGGGGARYAHGIKAAVTAQRTQEQSREQRVSLWKNVVKLGASKRLGTRLGQHWHAGIKQKTAKGIREVGRGPRKSKGAGGVGGGIARTSKRRGKPRTETKRLPRKKSRRTDKNTRENRGDPKFTAGISTEKGDLGLVACANQVESDTY